MRKLMIGLFLGLLGILGAAAPAAAQDPAPPTDPAAPATSALANFGDKAFDTFGGLVTNTWVLAIFAFGIGMSFVAGYIAKVRRRTSHGVA